MSEQGIEHLHVNIPELATVIAEMIRYASETPFDMNRAAEEAKKAGAEVDEQGAIRVKNSDKRIPWMMPYNRFITMDGKTPLQLTYTISDIQGTIVCQLTIINNQKEKLQPGDVGTIVPFFFSENDEAMVVKTPPHVMVIVAKRTKKGSSGRK